MPLSVLIEHGATLTHCLATYNHLVPQRALKHQTPIQALKTWQLAKPDLFVKRVYKQADLTPPLHLRIARCIGRVLDLAFFQKRKPDFSKF